MTGKLDGEDGRFFRKDDRQQEIPGPIPFLLNPISKIRAPFAPNLW